MNASSPNQACAAEDTRAEWIAPEVSELPLTELTQGTFTPTGSDAGLYS